MLATSYDFLTRHFKKRKKSRFLTSEKNVIYVFSNTECGIYDKCCHCSHIMRQCVCNGTVSVCPSVCSIHLPLQQRAAGCCCGPDRQATSIGKAARCRSSTAHRQQQMRAVSRCQLTQEAERGLVINEQHSAVACSNIRL